MSKPRLLWWGDAVAPTGFAKVTHNVLRFLSDRSDRSDRSDGWDVAVLGINHRGDPHAYPYPIYPAAAVGNMWGLGRFPDIVRKVQPDVVLVQNDPWNVAEALGQIETAGCPLVAWMPVDAPNMKRATAAALNRLDLAIWYTEFARNEARKAGHTGPAIVVPLGVDVDVFRPIRPIGPIGRIGGRFVVGNVNRNHLRKRLDLTIAAFAAWLTAYRHTDACLHLCCSSTDTGWDLPQLAEYHGIGDRLILTDTAPVAWEGIPEEALRAIYCGFDAQLTTTAGEGWGLTTLEGMACGIPQIVPEYAALGEWARRAALLVPVTSTLAAPGHINTIAGIPDLRRTVEALERVHGDPALRATLAERSLALAQQPQYRWEAIAQRIDEALRAAINRSPLALSQRPMANG